jgi:hypothetical protein
LVQWWGSAADFPSAGSVESRPSIDVKEEIKITFDEFGWRALNERAVEEGASLDELVSLALSYYESELSSARVATDVPRFRQAPRGEARSLTIEIDEDVMRRIAEEGERRGVALERVCEHAALLFLADLDAGKVAQQVIRRARSRAGPPRFGPGTSA